MADGGGFADPAREAARAFRGLLDAMARPGRAATLAPVAPPEGLSPAAATVLACLADAETPVWLPARLRTAEATGWLAFFTNAPLADAPPAAQFAVGRWDELAPLSQWPAGEAAYPDRSATLVVEAPLEGGPALTLSGPGIDGTTAAAPQLPPEARAALAANRARFPLGVDLFLAEGDRVLGLPRSTKVGGA